MTTPPPTPDLEARAARALETLAAITGELASARALETNIERILRRMEAHLEAREASVWLHTPHGLARGWSGAAATITESEVTS